MSSVVAAGPSIPTDAELLWRYARRRDDEAFARVVGRHMRAVRHVAFRFTHHRQAAEDVAQAAFLVMAQRPRQAMRSAKWKRSALPWLAKVCRYAAANWRRAEERRLRHESTVARREMSRDDPTAGTELAEAVRSALACLPRRERRIVEWRHLSQMPWDEVARHAGTTPEAARKAGTRALSQLRVVLEKRGITAGSAAVLAGLRAVTATSSASAATGPALTMSGAPELAKGVLVMMKIKAYASAAAVISLGAAGMIAISVAATEPGAPASRQAAPATTATTDPAPFTVDLGKGGKLEVLWLAEHSPDGRAWHADGTLLAKRPRELPFYVERPGLIEIWLKHSSDAGPSDISYTAEPLPNELGLEEVLNWDQEINRELPPPVIGKRAEEQDERQMRFSNAVSELRRAGLLYVVVDPRDDAVQLGLDVTAPIDEWQVLQQWGFRPPQPQADRADYVGGGAEVGTESATGRSVKTSWFARGLSHWDLKVQLITKDGDTLDPRDGTPYNWIDAGQMRTGDATFHGAGLRDVSYFQIVGRPRGPIRLRGLAAAHGVKAEPAAHVGPQPSFPWEREPAE